MSKPLVSFIIPAFNSENYIHTCVDSILSQDCDDCHFEVIVVDNGSTDLTVDTVRKYNQVKLISEPKKGVSYARNTGVKNSSGELIAFVDSTVTLANNWLSLMLKMIGGQSPVVAQGRIFYVPYNDVRDEIYKFVFRNSFFTTRGSFNSLQVGEEELPYMDTASCIVTRSLFEQYGGFDPRTGRYSDRNFGHRLYYSGVELMNNTRATSYKFANYKTRKKFLIDQAYDSYFSLISVLLIGRSNVLKVILRRIRHYAHGVSISLRRIILKKSSMGLREKIFSFKLNLIKLVVNFALLVLSPFLLVYKMRA